MKEILINPKNNLSFYVFFSRMKNVRIIFRVEVNIWHSILKIKCSDCDSFCCNKKGKKAGKLSVLETVAIDGYKYRITKLDKNAFKNAAAKRVTLGRNITAIPKGAFFALNESSRISPVPVYSPCPPNTIE